MKKYQRTILCFVLFLASVNIVEARKTADSAKDASDVRQAFNNLVAAFNALDAKTAVSYFADGIVLVSPAHPDIGYKELDEEFTKRFKIQPKEPFTAKVNIEEIQVSGDLAFIRVIWSRERNSDKAILSGEKDVEIWQRQKNGQWKLARGYSFPLKKDSPNWTKGDAAIPQREVSASKTRKKSDSDIEKIKKAIEKIAQTYNNRDLTGRMSFYAADSLLTYPEQPDADIKQSRKNYGENFSNLPPFPFRSFYEIKEVQASGHLAFVQMIWFVERQSDKQIVSRLRDLEIWQRQSDGSWKLSRGLSFHLKPENVSGAPSPRRLLPLTQGDE